MSITILHPARMLTGAHIRAVHTTIDALNRLNEPGINPPIDAIKLDNERIAIVTPHVDGTPLAQELTQRLITPPRCIAILRQLSRILGRAHAAGVSHGALSVSSLLLSRRDGKNDALTVTDFGLQGIIDTGIEVTDKDAAWQPVTPERIVGLPRTHREDVYLVGCLAYAMLTGVAPFRTGDPEAVRRRHAIEDPMPIPDRLRGKRVPPKPLVELVHRCLAKDPEERFESMVELEAAVCMAQLDTGIRTPWDLPIPDIDGTRRDLIRRALEAGSSPSDGMRTQVRRPPPGDDAPTVPMTDPDMPLQPSQPVGMPPKATRISAPPRPSAAPAVSGKDSSSETPPVDKSRDFARLQLPPRLRLSQQEASDDPPRLGSDFPIQSATIEESAPVDLGLDLPAAAAARSEREPSTHPTTRYRSAPKPASPPPAPPAASVAGSPVVSVAGSPVVSVAGSPAGSAGPSIDDGSERPSESFNDAEPTLVRPSPFAAEANVAGSAAASTPTTAPEPGRPRATAIDRTLAGVPLRPLAGRGAGEAVATPAPTEPAEARTAFMGTRSVRVDPPPTIGRSGRGKIAPPVADEPAAPAPAAATNAPAPAAARVDASLTMPIDRSLAELAAVPSEQHAPPVEPVPSSFESSARGWPSVPAGLIDAFAEDQDDEAGDQDADEDDPWDAWDRGAFADAQTNAAEASPSQSAPATSEDDDDDEDDPWARWRSAEAEDPVATPTPQVQPASVPWPGLDPAAAASMQGFPIASPSLERASPRRSLGTQFPGAPTEVGPHAGSQRPAAPLQAAPHGSPGAAPQSPVASPGAATQGPFASPSAATQSPFAATPGAAPQSPFASPGAAPQGPFATPNAASQGPFATPNPAQQSPFATPNPAQQSPFATPNPAQQSPFATPNPASQGPFATPNPAQQSPFASPSAASQGPFATPNPAQQSPFASPNAAPQGPFASPNAAPQGPFATPTPAPQSPFASPTASPQRPFATPTAAPQSPFASPAAAPQSPFASPAAAPQSPFASPSAASQSPFASPAAAPQSPFASPAAAPQSPFASPSAAPQSPFASPTAASQSPFAAASAAPIGSAPPPRPMAPSPVAVAPDPGDYRSPLELPVVPLPNAALPQYRSPLELAGATPTLQAPPGNYASPLEGGGYASPLQAAAPPPRPMAPAPARMAPALDALPSVPVLMDDDDLTAALRANRRRTWLLGFGVLFFISAFVGAMIALQGG